MTLITFQTSIKQATQSRYFQDTDLAAFTTAQGFKVLGAMPGDTIGNSVSVGDFNGDGYSDIIIGADRADPNGKSDAGTSYVIFGKASNFNNIDLASLTSTQGFKIIGASSGDGSGQSLSSAGDFNGDGFSDIIIGAPFADPNSRINAGISYLIFGKSTGFTDIDLAALTSTQGFKILGAGSYYNSGWSVASACDFNGDGYSDIILGARYADYNSRINAGISYLIFGKSSGFSDIDLASLTSAQGFKIIGAAMEDNSGEAIASIGDFNGDGYSDILIGSPYASPNSRSEAGVSYVIFGKASGFSDIDLASLTSTQGFKILGASSDDWSGRSLSSAGDFNGDGYSDLIIGASYTYANSRANAGTSYIIFGKASGFSDIDLASLTSIQGFKIIGAARNHYSGWSVKSAGDLNVDGFSDVIIGAQVVEALQSDPISRTNAGISYVIFGKANGFTDIDLASLTSTQGFKILGAASNDYSGGSASVGDFNGDGYNDIIIGAFGASPNSKTNSGIAYVILDTLGTFSPTKIPTIIPMPASTISNMPISNPTSSPSFIPSAVSTTITPTLSSTSTIDLSVALSSTKGFTILGGAAGDYSGRSVAAGDVNNDGYDDIIIGSRYASPNFRTEAGQSYVIYGSATNPGTIDLSVALSSTQGFTILGGAADDYSGRSIASAGDVNNDGYDDIIIGAYGADPSSRIEAGQSYVIYGSATNPGTIDLSIALSSTQGFTILGGAAYDQSGWSVASAGDVNNDGYDDIIIGAPYADPNSRMWAGQSYVIYGSATNPGTIDLSIALSSTQGFTILGCVSGDESGDSVASAGDVNNDGYDDIIIGAYYASPISRIEAGQSYVIYGSATNLGTIDLSIALSSTQGFTILGGASYDSSGWSVASAGDVNNDGYDDIIIGAPYADPSSRSNAGQSYVIYGSATNPGTIDLSIALSSTQGFTILGGAADDQSGWSVASAGDVNNDGYDDIIIGAPDANSGSRLYAGQSYVIYGSTINLGTIDLSVALSSTQGFTVLGGSEGDWSGSSVASAGDVNDDGFDDIIIGAYYASPISRIEAGQSYVIYGAGSDPSVQPTREPSGQPTLNPTTSPTLTPTILPTSFPTSIPTLHPTSNPTISTTSLPSNLPEPYSVTAPPTFIPTTAPTKIPTTIPTPAPTPTLSNMPSSNPSSSPSLLPSNTPNPTSSPSFIPSAVSTTITPTLSSTSASFTSSMPTLSPSIHPTTILGDNAINSSDGISMLSIIGIIIGSLSGTCIFAYATYKCYGFRSKSGVKIADDADNNHISLSNQERHTKNYNGDVLLSIDAVSDPIHYNLQNKEFSMFANHLTHFIKEDLVKNIESIGESALSQLLIKSTEDEIKIVSVDQEFVPNYIQSDSYDDSILQLLNAKQMLHNLPLLHYISQNTINSLGYNISLPDPSDNKALLVSLDLVLGNMAAQYLPAESVMNAIFVSTASSISFAARLITADYLKNQEPSDEPIEFAQQCGLIIAAHSLPTVVNYAFAKAFLPNAEMSILDMLGSSSFGVVQCYNNYKPAYEAEFSALNTVVPYIADALTLWTLKDYMTFDTSSVGSLSISIKNAISVAATTYAVHCVSDVVMDFMPQGVQEYIDTAFSYVTEAATNVIDNLYDNLMDISIV